MGGVPALVGETGIPYDLNGKKAYHTGDFSSQEKAYNRVFTGLEDNLLSYTLWNYTVDNDNLHGDQWNGEDLSIFSRDQQKDPKDLNSGGRALKAVIRPFPMKTAGEPLKQEFDYRSGKFLFEFKGDPTIQADTEIFLPKFQYPKGAEVTVSDGSYELDEQKQLLVYRPGDLPVHQILIYRK